MERIKAIVGGDLRGLPRITQPDHDAAEWLSATLKLDAERPSVDEVATYVNQLANDGKALEALACLKILAVEDHDGAQLRPLLEQLILREQSKRSEAATTELLISEFLGTDRGHIAWSVLCRDRLELCAAPGPDGACPGDLSVVCCDPRVEDASAPHGLMLAWRRRATVQGASRPGGQRKFSRRKLPLRVRLRFVGSLRGIRSDRWYEAEVLDVSLGGVGVSFPNAHSWLSPRDVSKQRVRLEIPLVEKGQVTSSLANVAWCRCQGSGGEQVLHIGLQFHEPTAEFLVSIRDLIQQKRSDQQYLWNLWDSQEKKT
jgi:hypothetical protein